MALTIIMFLLFSVFLDSLIISFLFIPIIVKNKLIQYSRILSGLAYRPVSPINNSIETINE